MNSLNIYEVGQFILFLYKIWTV